MMMQVEKDDIKTQFSTIEGLYKLLPVPEYNRSNRIVTNIYGSNVSNPPVKVSLLSVSNINSVCSNSDSYCERTNICYNYGRDLFVYSYKSSKAYNNDCEFPRPIEKRSYNKDEIVMCHDFNSMSATIDRVLLLVGLLGGQIQLFDPISKEINKSFNSGERLIDKSKVTCLKWIPKSTNQFIVSHSSGQMYTYNIEYSCSIDKPVYQLLKQGENYSTYICKSRSSRNPLHKWSVGDGSINNFQFSACSKYLAVVSQDGFLRIFIFDTMELYGSAKSYYGGLLCVCWSPDGKYIVVGGEDDLISIWSFNEKRIVARCQGHKSWVTVVAFDPYITIFSDRDSPDCRQIPNLVNSEQRNGKLSVNSSIASSNSISSDGILNPTTNYRLGSVSQDTFLCLWDLIDDMLQQPYFRARTSTANSVACSGDTQNTSNSQINSNCQFGITRNSYLKSNGICSSDVSSNSNYFASKLASLNFGDKKDKLDKDLKKSSTLIKNSSSLRNMVGKNVFNSAANTHNSTKIIGTSLCPRLDQCPTIEPVVCKKIGHERLCDLIFREDSIITSCQDGCILTWCRPGKYLHNSLSPTLLIGDHNNSCSTGGTIV